MDQNQSKKYVIVGGVAGGASIAARLRRLDEFAQITMIERGRDVSFSNCSLPYFLGGEIEDAEALKLISPKTFHRLYRITALTRHEVTLINREARTVLVRDLESDVEQALPYDKLFLAPCASPIMPSAIPGIGLPQVFSVRSVEDVERIDAFLKARDVRQVAVVGGGFIGIEVMENLTQAGYSVSVVDMAPQVMLPFDEDMAQILHREIIIHGVSLILGDGLSSIEEDGITLSSGRRVPAQAVIMAIGVRPETALAVEAGLDIGKTGAILVDRQMRTSDPDIFAVGDAVEVRHLLTGKQTRLALAGPALRQARVAANTAAGLVDVIPGVVGASVLRVFSLNAAAVGLNERQCVQEGIDYSVSFVIPSDRVSIMPGASPMFFKLLYHKGSGQVLGAQAIGQGAADKRIDVIATLLRYRGTIMDLKDLELAYSPAFSTARDVVSQGALVACSVSDGLYDQVMFTQVRGLVEQGAYFVDVRTAGEFARAHIKGSVNIPLSHLRERLEEIPRDRPVYMLCRTGQRSYNAVRALKQRGWEQVYNVAGSFMALSWYEYYRDQTSGREPIVTAYEFE